MRAALYIATLIVFMPLSIWAEDLVKVNIQWDYKDINGAINLYEVKSQARLWETKTVKSIDLAPVGDKMPSSLKLKQGQTKRFALVMKNETDKPISFFASPHIVHPAEHSLGFKFKCLCINHAFNVAPHEIWYRIVEFRLDKEFVGNELTVTHSIIGIDQKRASSFSKEPQQPDL